MVTLLHLGESKQLIPPAETTEIMTPGYYWSSMCDAPSGAAAQGVFSGGILFGARAEFFINKVGRLPTQLLLICCFLI